MTGFKCPHCNEVINFDSFCDILDEEFDLTNNWLIIFANYECPSCNKEINANIKFSLNMIETEFHLES